MSSETREALIARIAAAIGEGDEQRDTFQRIVLLSPIPTALRSDAVSETREALIGRLQFLADTLMTRWTTQRASDERPCSEVPIPTRELDAAVTAMREALAALPRGRGTQSG